MKNYFILFIFFFLTNISFCQVKTEYLIQNIIKFSNSNVDWKDSSVHKIDSLRAITAKQLYNDTITYNLILRNEVPLKKSDFSYDYSIEEFSQRFSPLFHFIDLNNDRVLDLVIYGRTGGYEITDAIMFLKENNLYKFINWYNGRIVEIIKRLDNKYDMVIYTYPCCEMIQNIFTYISFDNTKFISIDSISFAKGFFYCCKRNLPDEINSRNEITLAKETKIYFLPDFSSDTSCLIVPRPDSLITYYAVTNKRVKTYCYASFIDSKNKKWNFVSLKSNEYKYDFKWEKYWKQTNLVGWVLSE